MNYEKFDHTVLDTRRLKPGQIGWIPTSYIRPSQPDDGYRSDSSEPITIDVEGVIIHGNHRYWSMQAIMDELFVKVIDPPF